MSLLAWPITLLGLMFMYPWACWLLRRERDPLLLALTTLALSIGALSLVMLWIGLSGLRIDWRIAAIICTAISLSGWFVVRRQIGESARPTQFLPESRRGLALGVAIIVSGIAALIVFNAVYWPLGIDDAIAIYGWYGKLIAQSGALPHGALYDTYPMLIPLSYAFTHQAAGWVDEHLAALIPALLSVGGFGVAYLLGRELYDRATGLAAALLTALAPTIVHWASTGYADLPTAFYYGLTGVFLLRHRRYRRWQDALLAGIMAGLAAWTKNSGLLIVLSISGWIMYCAWLARTELPRPLSRRDVLLIVVGFIAMCGIWYARNLIIAGVIIPPTGWTWKAARSLDNLLPYLTDSRYFLSGAFFTAGLGFALWQVWRSAGHALSASFLLIFYVPFFVIWWVLFSYDSRFLLVLTPYIAVMSGHFVISVAARLAAPQLIPQPRTTALLIGAMLLVALPALSAAVDYKPELLRHPLMSDAEKHRVRLGDRYDVGLYLGTLPPDSRIWTQDILLPYYADHVRVTVGSWPNAEQLRDYDFWVLAPGEIPPDNFDKVQPLYQRGEWRVYTIKAQS